MYELLGEMLQDYEAAGDADEVTSTDISRGVNDCNQTNTRCGLFSHTRRMISARDSLHNLTLEKEKEEEE